MQLRQPTNMVEVTKEFLLCIPGLSSGTSKSVEGLTYTMDIQICKPHSSANLIIKGLIFLEARDIFL